MENKPPPATADPGPGFVRKTKTTAAWWFERLARGLPGQGAWPAALAPAALVVSHSLLAAAAKERPQGRSSFLFFCLLPWPRAACRCCAPCWAASPRQPRPGKRVALSAGPR